MDKLGKLTKADPRSVWEHEARDFTPWLRRNIDLLKEAVGLELDLVETESPVGNYAVDLYAKDLNTGHWAIIENQLEQTDHGHLGQLMAYAAGKEAGVVIWISPKFRDEHKQTLDWLNQITDGSVSFFGIELELLQIDNSLPAPYLKVVAQPSEWAGLGPPSPGVTERQERYQVFFSSLLEQVKARYPNLTRARKAYPQNWYNFPVGRAGFSVATSFTQNRQLRVELYMDGGDKSKNKAAFDALEKDRDVIEEQIGLPIAWQRLDEKQACRIYCDTEGSIDDDPVHLAELEAWAVELVGKFHKVFKPRVKKLKL